MAFSPADRDRVRAELIESARGDARIAAAAVTGSAAVGAEDRWSDVDLAVAVDPPEALAAVLDDWTGRMYRAYDAVHHLDLHAEHATYRVFLLADTLQVDVAVQPGPELLAVGPTFRLLYGGSRTEPVRPPPAAAELLGWAWLYALHARSSIERARPWQAEYMISGVRDQVLALACLRHDLPTAQGRGLDQLPTTVTGVVATVLVTSLETAELRRALRAVTGLLLGEAGRLEAAGRLAPGLADRLAGPLREIAGTAPG